VKIKCSKCGHSEKTTVELFVKIIGGAMPIGGFLGLGDILIGGYRVCTTNRDCHYHGWCRDARF